jgi:hypothetical protein
MKNTNNKNKGQQRSQKALQRDFEENVKEILEGPRNVMSKVAHEYYKSIVDLDRAKRVGIPAPFGGGPYLSSVQDFTVSGTMATGTASTGFLTFNGFHFYGTSSTLRRGGPYSDTTAVVYTDATYTKNSAPAAGDTGAVSVKFTDSPFLGTLPVGDLAFRVVAVKISVWANEVFTSQNGSVLLYEDPVHEGLNAHGTSQTYETLSQVPHSREVSMLNLATDGNECVLNWHPKGSNVFSPFGFHGAGDNATTDAGPLVVAVQAAPGTTLKYRVTARYELVGRKVRGKRRRVFDSRGIDLVLNALARKRRDGWYAKPREAEASYKAHWYQSALELGERGLKALSDYAIREVKGLLA